MQVDPNPSTSQPSGSSDSQRLAIEEVAVSESSDDSSDDSSSSSSSSSASSSSSSSSSDDEDKINEKLKKLKRKKKLLKSKSAEKSSLLASFNASNLSEDRTERTSTPKHHGDLFGDLDLSSEGDGPTSGLNLSEQSGLVSNQSRDPRLQSLVNDSTNAANSSKALITPNNSVTADKSCNRRSESIDRQSCGSASSQSLTAKEAELGISMEDAPFLPERERDWYIADVDNFSRKGTSVTLSGNGKMVTVREPERFLEIREAGGRTCIAPIDPAECPSIMFVLASFSKPNKGDKFVEKESRDRTWKTLTSFLNSKGTFREALGGWSRDPDCRGVLVKELPAQFKDAVTGNKLPNKAPTSYTPTFKLSGTENSFTKGFFEATTKTQSYTEFSAWKSYLAPDRIPKPSPAKVASVEKNRKELEPAVRASFIASAINSLADHASKGGKNEEFNKVRLLQLFEVTSALSKELCNTLEPSLVAKVEKFKESKLDLRKEVLNGISPPSITQTLLDSEIFSEDLFPKETFMKVDEEAIKTDDKNVFPSFMSRGLKRPTTTEPFFPPKKRTKPNAVPAPVSSKNSNPMGYPSKYKYSQQGTFREPMRKEYGQHKQTSQQPKYVAPSQGRDQGKGSSNPKKNHANKSSKRSKKRSSSGDRRHKIKGHKSKSKKQ